MRSPFALLALLAAAPLFVPAVLLVLRLASELLRGGSLPSAGESWLLLFGPAIPVYLLALPLAPFLLIAQHRGWRPRPWWIVALAVAVGLLFDLAFRLRAGL